MDFEALAFVFASPPLDARGVVASRVLPGGLELTVQPLTGMRGRLTIGRLGDSGYDEGW